MLKSRWITLWITLWVNLGVSGSCCLVSPTGTGPWRPEREEAAADSSFLFHVKLRGLRGAATFAPLRREKDA